MRSLMKVACLAILFSQTLFTFAQDAAVPRVVQFNGVLETGHSGQIQSVTFALYREQQGGAPVWQETQNIAVSAEGQFNAVLGAATNGGLPVSAFTDGESRWLGVQVNGSGDAERPRILVTSVPYALKAADADTLGGKPLSAFVLAPDKSSDSQQSKITADKDAATASAVSGTGTTDRIVKWTDGPTGTLGDSTVTESAGNVGIGNAAPATRLDIAGATRVTGLTIPTSGVGLETYFNGFGGLLSYDRTGQTYRELRLEGSPFTFYNAGNEAMRVHTNNNVGIGTSTPGARLDVTGTARVTGITIPTSGVGLESYYYNGLGGILAYDRTAQTYKELRMEGSPFTFYNAGVEAMRIHTNSNVGIGTSTPFAKLDVFGDINISTPGNLGFGVLKVGGAPFLHNYRNNTFLGLRAGNFFMSGDGNTGVGDSALSSNETGIGNAALGLVALRLNTTGRFNTAIGASSLETNSTGNSNTGIGAGALSRNATGSNNSALGGGALGNNGDGHDNAAVGYLALLSNTTGINNSALGGHALTSNGSGTHNTAVGESALDQTTTGSFNTAVGTNAGRSIAVIGETVIGNTNGTNGTFIGYNSGTNTTVQLNNATAIGANAHVSASNALVLGDSVVSVGIGTEAPGYKLDVQGGQINASGGLCINGNCQTSWPAGGGSITGVTAGTGLSGGGTTGTVTLNVANGGIGTTQLADFAVTSAKITDGTIVNADISASATIAPTKIAGTAAILGANTFNGTQTVNSGNLGLGNTVSAGSGVLTLGGVRFLHNYGTDSTFVGTNAGNFSMTNPINNTGVGAGSLSANTTGTGNTAIGTRALQSNTDGTGNTASGVEALSHTTTGWGNTGTGSGALRENTTGIRNTAIGTGALNYSNGNGNTAMGFSSGYYGTTGDNNTSLGAFAGLNVASDQTSANNTFVGAFSGPGLEVSMRLDNATAIGYAARVSTSNALVLGNSSVSVGIGTSAPTAKLDVNGGVRLNTATAKPVCDANSRGTFWFTQGAAGVKDTAEVCAKDAADAFAWRVIY